MTDNFDDLLNKLKVDYSTLQQTCPSLFSTDVINSSGLSNALDISYTGDVNSATLQQLYYNKVEEGNNYLKELLDIEEAYFKKKYGDQIYDHIKEERSNYINKKVQSGSYSVSDVGLYKKLLDTEYRTFIDISNSNMSKVTSNYKTALGVIEDNINSMFDNKNKNKRKVEYRDEVIKNVNYTNNLLTILYYIVFITLVIILSINQTLNFSTNWWLYIIMLFFPIYIYPFIYKLITSLYLNLKNYFKFYGPKNAFLNEKYKLKFLDDYNI